MKYVIVQAGGRGSRLETLTTNKPKALVPVDNLPMIFHLFKKYPEAKFLIIADYQKETFKRYLNSFAQADYEIIEANKKGTCSGMQDCMKMIPDNTPFMIIWCDLVLSEMQQERTLKSDTNYLGISKDFSCRWSYKNGKFEESPSSENGVAGMFVFKNKAQISDVPEEGEFVRYLSRKEIRFSPLAMYGGIEIGTMLSYFQNELNKPKCRPFNKMDFKGDIILKYPINEQGEKLAQDEVSWYKMVTDYGYTNIPKLHGYNPIVMDRIKGDNVYQYAFLTNGFKKALLERIVATLDELHNLLPVEKAVEEDCEVTYLTKTFDRLSLVKDLVPFAADETITINGRKCTSIFAIKNRIIAEMREMYPEKFCLIHGDCTFHNIMIESENVRPILIDPRGYFGKTKFFGDKDYDWAKLYYSVVGNYDQFNRKNFSLEIKDNGVELMIVSNNWEQLHDYFFELTKADCRKIKLLHALIWLSLTTYAWEDYDAICGAFYKGTLELQDYLDYVK